jgi:NADH-quinone oxidoreductase subunit N
VALSTILLIFGNLFGGRKLTANLFSRFLTTSLVVCIFIELRFFLSSADFYDRFFIYTNWLSFVKLISLVCFAAFFILTKIDLQNWIYALSLGLLDSILTCLSANHFLILLLGLEIFTFLTCVLVMQNKGIDGVRECSVRFLIVSECMTGLILYGLGLLCPDGGLSFTDIHFVDALSFKIGGVLVVSGLLFKLGLAPFHTWLIDLYEKSSMRLVMFFDALWKFVMITVFVRVFAKIASESLVCFKLSLKILSIVSMLIGAIMPILEKNIKRFVAYSSVGHIGFILTVFANSAEFTQIGPAIVYSFFYSIASICFFASLGHCNENVRTFDDIPKDAGRASAYCMILSLLAMIGMPPFANFFAKLQILKLQVHCCDYPTLATSIVYSILCLVFVSQKALIIMRNREENAYNRNRTIMIFGIILISIVSSGNVSMFLTEMFGGPECCPT